MIKDRAGVALMFMMPLVLVLVMTVLQDNTFKAVSESKVEILLLNNDKDILGNTIEKKLIKEKLFDVHRERNGGPLTLKTLKNSIARGEYRVGVVIPADATRTIRRSIGQSAAKNLIKGYKADYQLKKNIEILIYIDPAIRESYKISMISSLREMAAEIKKDFVIDEVVRVISKMFTLPGTKLEIKNDLITYREEYAVKDSSSVKPNSVQHNVPAWTLFAMFFIVISLAGNMIHERHQGSYTRLLTMPVSFFQILFSKVTIYFLVCCIQFVLMLLMGIYILPLVGLPALETGDNLGALLLIVCSSAFAAVGYSILVGVLASTINQISSFGAISVVVMSAIGGIWVPVFVMPEFMQNISVVSPLNWGIKGFYTVFIRGGDVLAVLPNALALIIFSIFCISVAVIYNRYKGTKE